MQLRVASPNFCQDQSIGTFFFNDTAPTEIYTLSLHDALPISVCAPAPLPDELQIENKLHERRFGFLADGHGVYSRSEEHTSELQSQSNIVCRLLLEKKTQTTSQSHLTSIINYRVNACSNAT